MRQSMPTLPSIKRCLLRHRELGFSTNTRHVLRTWRPGQPPHPEDLFQARALRALERGTSIPDKEYNIYVAGSPGLGRTYLVERFVQERARKEPTPPDLVYVHNFTDPDRPLLLSLPAGHGRILKDMLQRAMRRLRRDLPRHFEKASYQRSQSKLLAQLASAREDLMGKMEETAGRHGFSLAIDGTGGISLTPLVEGKVLTSEEYDRLDAPRKKDIKAQSSAVLTAISDLTR